MLTHVFLFFLFYTGPAQGISISTETNNDIEGWHNALNRRAQGRCSLPFYMLIDMLYTEAKLTLVEIKLVSDGKLSKFQGKVYRQQQRKIFKA